ncbi:MAG TPA: HNH endonuclease [Thermoanaerobaculia bacterium]|nr:HNH endonuclease [Thermoanaerobaculia bacterium]
MGSSQREKPLEPVGSRAAALVWPPFPCPNCDEPVPDARLFCSELCREEAKYVRYYRTKIDDGSIVQADIRDALRMRLAHILAGGYHARLRQVPVDVRRAVIERDGGRCRACDAPGEEIDHIRGSKNDLSNLQLLCVDCHWKKTTRRMHRISAKSHPEEWAKANALVARVQAVEPIRLCDDPSWERRSRTIQARRRRSLAFFSRSQ